MCGYGVTLGGNSGSDIPGPWVSRDPEGQSSPVALSPPPFEGRGELSFVSTGGNAQTQTLGFSTELIRRQARTTTNGRASFLRSATDDVENARVVTGLIRQSIRLSDRVEAFARGGYLRDNFAGIQHRVNADAGLSYVVRQPPQRALKFDFGLGGTRENRLADVDQAVLNATLGVSLRARLSPTAEVAVDSQAIADLERIRNYRFLSDLSLTASLNSMWSARLAYGTRYANQPVPGFQRADHTVSASLAIRYVRPAPGGRR